MLFYYSLAAAFLALLVVCKYHTHAKLSSPQSHTYAAYRYRATIVLYMPERVRSRFPTLSNYTPLATFNEQVSAGMTSSAFDLESNIRDGDSRTGLDEQATKEVMEIMKRERVK
jgi:DNA helicase IV